MYCKNCGKNIYDLEKCPFCNGEADKGNENQAQDNQNPPQYKQNGEFFTDRIRKSNPAYRLADITEIVTMVVVGALFIIFLIKDWMAVEFTDFSLFFYTLGEIMPFCWLNYIMAGAIAVQGISLMYSASKEKTKTAELFEYIKHSCKENPGAAYSHESYIGDTWKVIMYRHNKKGFWLSWGLWAIGLIKPFAYVVLGVPAIKHFTYYLLLTKSPIRPQIDILKDVILVDKVIILVCVYAAVKIAEFAIKRLLKTEKEIMLGNYPNGKYQD